MARLTALLAVSLVVVLGAFSYRAATEPTLPATPYDYDGIALPAYLDTPPVRAEDNTPADNPTTDAGATLGRVLFYDTRLSQNESVSCASCHRQEQGFSDGEVFSVGFEGGRTERHSMGLAFARYYRSGRFFWDERAATLEEQVLQPIQDGVEMGMTLGDVTARLEATDFYPGLFADAFGTDEVTPDRISKALAQFVRAIVSPNTRYDDARQAEPQGPPGQPLAGLTAQENQGLRIFFGAGRCAQCHTGDLFVGDEARNNGLDATLTDIGAGDGRFKTGSLRNIGLTAPYMHDGRFGTLAEVVEHYSTGIQPSPTLDSRLQDPGGRPIRLNLNGQERAAVVAFLETLTDETLATDPRFSDPFAVITAEENPGVERTVGLALAGANPVRGATAFRVSVATPGPVRVEVIAMTGRVVATLLDATVAGETTVPWRPDGLAAGVYIVRLTSADGGASVPVTVVR